MLNDILGYSQEQALNCGLSVTELLILKGFATYYHLSERVYIEGDYYCRITTEDVDDWLPVFNITEEQLSESLQVLVKSGILIAEKLNNQTYYNFGVNYYSLTGGESYDL